MAAAEREPELLTWIVIVGTLVDWGYRAWPVVRVIYMALFPPQNPPGPPIAGGTTLRI